MFKEKVLSLGGAIILLIVCIVGTYLITTITKNANDQFELPSLPAINTQKPAEFNDDQLFLYACIDAYDVQKSEIKDLKTFKTGDILVAFENNGITLCYLLDELIDEKPNTKQRLTALLGLAPDTTFNTVYIFSANENNVFRPAFNTDCTKNEMSVSQASLTNDQELFINKLLIDAANKKIAYTRLGYTYDYKGSDVFGLTQYALDSQYRTNVTTYSIDEFITSINN